MRRPTYADLKDRVAELEEENQALNEKLDSITDIAASEEEEEEEEDCVRYSGMADFATLIWPTPKC